MLRHLRLRSHARVRSANPILSIATSTSRRLTGPPVLASMSSRSRATRTTRAPSPGFRRPQRVIRQIAPSSRGVPLPHCEHAQPGRTTQVLPFSFSPSDGVHGVPRALRRFNPAIGVNASCLLLHDGRWHTVVLIIPPRHFCRSGPTCRSCLRFRPDLFSSG